MYVLTIES